MNCVSNLIVKPFKELLLKDKLSTQKLGIPFPDINIVQNVTAGKRQFKRVFKTDFFQKVIVYVDSKSKTRFVFHVCYLVAKTSGRNLVFQI